MIQTILTSNLPELNKLFKQYKVKRAYAFGSVCSDSFNEKSDIDLIISFLDGVEPLERGENWWSLMYALQDTLKRDVDLLTEETIVNPYFIIQVNKSKELIYGK